MYPPYISVSQRPSARSVALTRAAPPLVDPPSQEELVRRLVVRRDEHLAEQQVETAATRRPASVSDENLDRDRNLERRGGREGGARVPRCTGAGAEILDENSRDAGKRTGEAAKLTGQPRILVTARGRAGLAGSRQAEDRVDGRGGAPLVVDHGGHGQPQVPGRELDVEVEPGPAAEQVSLRHCSAVDADDDHHGPPRNTPGDPPE